MQRYMTPMNQAADNVTDMLQRRGVFPFPVAQGFVTVAASTLVLLVACLVFAPIKRVARAPWRGAFRSRRSSPLSGSAQLLVVQQGGFDLSVAGGVSLAVVIAAHYPDGDNARVLPRLSSWQPVALWRPAWRTDFSSASSA